MTIDVDKVFEILRKSGDDNLVESEITLDSNIWDELEFDSISFLTMALHISEIFGIDVSTGVDDYYRVKTVRDLTTFLESKIQSRSG